MIILVIGAVLGLLAAIKHDDTLFIAAMVIMAMATLSIQMVESKDDIIREIHKHEVVVEVKP